MPDRQSEIIKKLKKYSEAYTPEWRFDEENPDAGTALGIIFSEMQADTMKKFRQLPRKNRLEFFNYAGTELIPAQPAEGYVAFGLVNRDVEGTEVPKETRLLAEDNDRENSITFETVNDVYVTPAAICEMVQILPEQDGIYSIYERTFEEEKGPESFLLFGEHGINRQEHVLYLAHETLFYIEQEGCITLHFELSGRSSISERLAEKLADTGCMQYEYFSKEGYVPFDSVKADRTGIHLYKGKDQPIPEKTEYAETNAYWIRMKCLQIQEIETLAFHRILLSAACPKKYPDLIFAGGVEQQAGQYLAFGEQMGLHECVYFSSFQALQQKGAKITLSFQLDFLEIPTETYGQENPVDWKLVMKRTDFIQNPEYDIDIDEVIWEYFNGFGWKKLSESDSYAKVFTPESREMKQRIEITFFCPQDLSPILVESVEACYIRARILKMRNLYRWNGKYIPPVLSDTTFAYTYKDLLPTPKVLVMHNNLETRILEEKKLHTKQQVIRPYIALQEKTPTLYMGFDKPLDKGAVRIWMELLENKEAITSHVLFTCLCREKWKSLNIVDGTEGFRKTGILTLLENRGITQEILWGKERFWLKVSAEQANEKNWPRIASVYMNVTEIRAVETKIPEYFFVEPNEKNIELQLLNDNIYEAEVWVKEYHDLNEQQLKELREEYEVEISFANDGISREIWVRWKEVEHFSASGPEDCHYKINKINGIIRFSDGIHGKIPDAGTEETIRVQYKCGGGHNTNVSEGMVNRLQETVGFINQVSNVKPTAGGSDKETVEHAMQKSGQSFRHRNRAVTASDYEALALESDASIAGVKCYSNYNEAGIKSNGHIVLVVLLENHVQNKDYFFTVRNRCMEFLRSRTYAGLVEAGRLHIIPPEFVELSVTASILVKNMDSIMETRHRCLCFLENFLNPLTGNFDGNGWKFGYLPNQIQLQNALHSVPGVLHVGSLTITAFLWKNGRKTEVDLDEIADKKFMLAISGTHEIDILIGGKGR